MSYSVEIKPTAQEIIKCLPQSWQTRMIEQLKALQTNPRPKEAIKLPDFENIYRIEQDYRLFYQILDEALRIIVVTIDFNWVTDTV
jgi:mRNA-degrading endonuclease RelE of RelBE toxin-antitoxin system